MSQPKNTAIPLTLSGFLLDQLASYARLDGAQMHATGEEWEQQEAQRARLGDIITRRLLEDVAEYPVTGDIATALAEREQAYIDYRDDQKALES